MILLLTMPLVSLTVKYFGEQIHIRFEKIQAFFSDISARAQENLTGVRVVRAYAQEEAENRSFAVLNRAYVDRNLGLVRLSAVFRPLMMFLIGVGFAVILWYGGRETAQGRMTVGQFAAFNLYLEQLIWPLIAMGYVTNLVQRGTASLKRMHQIMMIEPAIADAPGIEPLPEIEGRIEFRDLSFRYTPEGPWVLQDLNLMIEPGESVAFIGRTGSGKSTLMNLVPRLLDADPGMVLVDGRPIREVPLKQLRENIGYVTQETFLFSETLAGEYCVWCQVDKVGGCGVGGRGSRTRKRHPRISPGFRDLRRRAGNHALRRSEAADCHRSRRHQAASNSDPR